MYVLKTFTNHSFFFKNYKKSKYVGDFFFFFLKKISQNGLLIYALRAYVSKTLDINSNVIVIKKKKKKTQYNDIDYSCLTFLCQNYG